MVDGKELADLIPKFDDLFNPTLEAIRSLGGSGSNDEIVEQIIRIMDLPEEVADFAHLGSHTQTALGYRCAWARTYLKKAGYLQNSSRGVWALTELGRKHTKVSPKEVAKLVREADSKKGAPESEDDELDWQDELISVLQEMDPAAFERLCQRVLRESGFIDVEVTGKTGDGGIDGRGLVRLGGLLTFPVVFQCKRYQGSVSASTIRDFRGAMSGRADRGLVMTTGRFTPAANEEATRDGVPPVDLVDGRMLADKLREYSLGVDSTEHVTYDVKIDRDWFGSL